MRKYWSDTGRCGRTCAAKEQDCLQMPWISRTIFASCSLLVAAGCALPSRPSVSLARTSSSSAHHRPGHDIDPNPAAALYLEQQPLELTQAIALALENNPELIAASYDLDAASAGRDVARSSRLPTVGLVGSYSHHLDNQRLVPATFNGEAGVFGRDIFAGNVVVTLPLFTGGRIVHEIQVAELLEAAATHGLARNRNELVFNVSSVFYNILAQRQVLASLQFSAQTLREHQRRVEELLASAKAARVDLLRTEVRIADIEQRLVREQNVQAILHRVLANLLGIDTEPLPGMEISGELSIDLDAPAVNAATGLTLAYSRRGDYLAAEAALAAQVHRVAAARAAHWPTVSAQASYGGRWAAEPPARPAGADVAAEVGQVGLVVSIPIFDAGRIENRVRQEQARLAAARQRLRKLQLQVRLDVEAATLNTSSARQRIEAIAKAIEQAEESLRIERQRFELGRGSITDVLDAQSALLDSQTNYYRALADYHISHAQFELATGYTP